MEAIFKKYYARLCHFAWQMLQDHEVVEDLVQDAFMSFWKHQDKIYDDEKAQKNYLYSAVRYACLNYIRHNKIKDSYIAENSFHPIQDPQIIHSIIKSELIDEIHNIISSMPEKCQLVFRLGYLEGLTNEEISKKLDISLNTVKTQKRRGLALVKTKLDPEFFLVCWGMLNLF